MNKFSIQNIQKIASLISELEYEKASSLFLQLRVLVKNDKSYEPIRNHLRDLIKNYEKINWSNEKTVTNNQFKESDLARILGHRKGYMSELVNGLRPFSKEDLIVINRLFKIKFEDLILVFINQERTAHIKNTLESLSNNKIRLTKRDFYLQMT